MEFLPIDSRAHKREEKHEKGDLEQATRCTRDRLGTLRQNGKAPVNEFDVDPINQQRGLSELKNRAESARGEAPAAPGVGEKRDDEEESDTHHEEIGARVPVIVNRVEVKLRMIEAIGDSDSGGTGYRKESKSLAGVGACSVGEQDKSGGKPSEGEG